MIRIERFVDRFGRIRFEEWRSRLDPVTQLRIDRAIDRLGLGNDSNLKSVGMGVSELKLDFGPGYRIYMGRRGTDWVILLSGGDKSRQSRDIKVAQQLWQEYLESL